MSEAGVLFGILSMFGFGIANSLIKKPSQEYGVLRTLFYRTLFSTLMLSFVFLFFINSSGLSLPYLFLALILSFIGFVPLASLFKAIEYGKLGVVIPTANSSAIITVLLAALFYGETLTIPQFLSFLMIIIGIILLTINPSDFKSSDIFKLKSGVPYAFLTFFLWGMLFFLYKIPVLVLGPFLLAALIEFGILVPTTITMSAKRISFKAEKKLLLYAFLIAFFAGFASLSFNIGITRDGVGIVTVLASSSPLISTIYGKMIYKEKLTLRQYIASFVVILGVALLGYLSS